MRASVATPSFHCAVTTCDTARIFYSDSELQKARKLHPTRMERCRNCGGTSLRDLGFIGILAPFFLKRVHRIELAPRPSSHPVKRLIQKFTRFLRPVLSRIHPTSAFVELQSCLDCSFIQTRFPFSDGSIANLYEDYRSDSYNKERTSYEPDYPTIQNRVGQCTENGLDRVAALTNWLKARINLNGSAMLDYGGSNGQYLPSLPGEKFLFEISDIQPVPGVTRISNESLLQRYPYVQLSHVLEHVTEPLQMVRHVATFVAEQGYLLIEVPQDQSTERIRQLQAGSIDITLPIHEHINVYSQLAVQKLIEASNLELAFIEAVAIISPTASQPYIRALARRPSKS
jgi:Methyltransferase domain